MKKLIYATSLFFASVSSYASVANTELVDVDQMLAQTFELIANNESRAALDNLNWLAKHGVSHDPRFHNTLVNTMQELWFNFAHSYAPAWKSYHTVYRTVQKSLAAAPQNCAAFDIALSYSQEPHLATNHISYLEQTEQQFPATWQRCWTLPASFKAIEFISEPLITQYIGGLSEHFKLHIVDDLNATYRDCDNLPYESLALECKDEHKQKLIDASVMYRDAAMAIHDDTSEAGRIGGYTIGLFLEWQAYDNRN
jgi:hypothetical protein